MLILFAQQAAGPDLQGYGVGWGTLSLLNAGLAQSKNRSGLGWWAASLLLGPIATFLLVAFCPRLEPPVPTWRDQGGS